LYVPLKRPASHGSHSLVAPLRNVLGTHAEVGCAVGWSEGCAVGAAVGVSVGASVGSAAGSAVGAGVGTATHAVVPWKPSVHVATPHSWHSWYAALSWYLPDGQW
jgi:hypothetical protein